MGRRFLQIIVLLFVLGSLGTGGVIGWVYSEFTRPGPLERETVVVVPSGGGVKSIATILAKQNIIRSALVFEWSARVLGDASGLQAGEFAFPAALSVREVIDILKAGKTVQRRLTVAEGLMSSQVVSQLNGTDGLEGILMVTPPEGSLLPETYYFSYGDDRQSIVDRMQHDMRAAMDRLWSTRSQGLPIETPDEAIILASIVEKETGVAAERARVAAVFINRLRLGMRLQSDPTVSYGITEGVSLLDRALSKTDLKTETPYNTYVIKGLPPGPIANPGLAAIEAVLRPAVTDELYFVADGSGGHAFAKTLDEHNRNVRKWRKIRAELNSGD